MKRTLKNYNELKESDNLQISQKNPQKIEEYNDFDDEVKIEATKFINAFSDKLDKWRTQTNISGSYLAPRIQDAKELLMLINSGITGDWSDSYTLETFNKKYEEIKNNIENEKKNIKEKGSSMAKNIEKTTSFED